MNKWLSFCFVAVFLCGYLGYEVFSNQVKITEHYRLRAAESDSSAQYYFMKYIQCKSK